MQSGQSDKLPHAMPTLLYRNVFHSQPWFHSNVVAIHSWLVPAYLVDPFVSHVYAFCCSRNLSVETPHETRV